MRKLTVFNQISVDGYFKTPSGDIGWMHRQDDGDEEFKKFSTDNAVAGGVLVFGRKTYETMAGFWPTPAAAKQFPGIAEQMNRLPKVVFSKTLDKPSWNNTTIVKDDPVAALKKMKSERGEPMAILGSGSIVSQLTQARLIDGYQLVVSPIVLGKGRTLFETVQDRVNLKLTQSRAFKNGNVVLWYDLG